MLEKNKVYYICHVRYNTTYCIYSALFIRKNVWKTQTQSIESSFICWFISSKESLIYRTITQLELLFFKNKQIF